MLIIIIIISESSNKIVGFHWLQLNIYIYIISFELTDSLQLGKNFSNHSTPLNCVINPGNGVAGLGGGEGVFARAATGSF